jgi:Tfp pilus assembly protein PilN
MIEINLLPQEYRVGDRTNFPLIATLAVGLVVVGGLLLWLAQLNGQVTDRKADVEELTEREKDLKIEADKVKKIEEEIKRQKTRQTTIINISQSKIMWSLKLVQFSDIMKQFDKFWIQNLTLTRSTRGGGQLSFALNATGRDLREVAKFRDALKNDPNFAYHFDELKSDSIQIQDLAGRYANASEKMVMTVALPLNLEGKE